MRLKLLDNKQFGMSIEVDGLMRSDVSEVTIHVSANSINTATITYVLEELEVEVEDEE